MQPWEQKFEFIYFAICAVLAIAGAIGTVAFPNPIRGALSLLFTIIAIAGIYLQLHAPFLAAIQLIVYAGAVVVLFLFVIMLIGPAANPARDTKGIVSRVAGALGISAVMVQVLMVLAQKVVPRMPPVQAGMGTVESFGNQLFSDYLVPFEVASVLLMVAIVGAVAVARGKQPDPQARASSEEDDDQPKKLPAKAAS